MKKTKIVFNEGRLTVIEKTSISVFCYTDIVGIFCDHPYLVIVTTSSFPSFQLIEKERK